MIRTAQKITDELGKVNYQKERLIVKSVEIPKDMLTVIVHYENGYPITITGKLSMDILNANHNVRHTMSGRKVKDTPNYQ